MTITKQERRICDCCGGAAMHTVKYKNGYAVYKKCSSCYAEFTREPQRKAPESTDALNSFFGFNN